MHHRLHNVFIIKRRSNTIHASKLVISKLVISKILYHVDDNQTPQNACNYAGLYLTIVIKLL